MQQHLLILPILALSGFVLQSDAVDVVPVPGGLSGDANTTRYWDCCKPACAWKNENFTKPVIACEADGETDQTETWTESGCLGGTAFACTRQHCYTVNDTFALGFASAFFGGVEESQCCKCFHLNVLGLSVPKEMIVQVINTGDDYQKESVTFDLSIPGGGVGYYNLGCPAQWDSPEDGWGQRYGGVETREGCSDLPEQLQEFCTFRFDFLEGISNPKATFEEVECPDELVATTGCSV